MIIGLTGVAGSGKDTVGKILCEDYGFTRFAFADALREVLLETDPYLATGFRLSSVLNRNNGDWDTVKWRWPEVRRLLQTLGVAIRSLDPGFWVRRLDPTLAPNIVVTDVRFPNEVRRVEELGGVVYRVIGRGGLTSASPHVSETAIETSLRVIDNSGTLDDLKGVVELMMKEGK